MSNFSLMTKQQRLDVLTKITTFSSGTLSFIEGSKSVYENYFITDSILKEDELKNIEAKFRELDRTPAIYFENREDLLPNKIFLREHGYTTGWNESWLFYESQVAYQDAFQQVKKVSNAHELEIFLNVFNNSYQKDGPQNPYGDVISYLPNTKSRWEQFGQSDYWQDFLAYDGDEAVAVATLTSKDGLGYISTVGSLRKVRGRGFGKLITLYCVYISQQMGNTSHFLITEEGLYPYEFYNRIGFVPKFKTVGMSK